MYADTLRAKLYRSAIIGSGGIIAAILGKLLGG